MGSDVDDALALALLLASPELRLEAVTTVGRNGPVRARATAALLALAGRNEIDVCIGAERPCLRAEERFNWFGHEEDCVADAPAAVSDEPGALRIVRAAREVSNLEIVAIGPMTTLAQALALDPKLPRRVASLTLMGGHVREVHVGGRLLKPGIDYNLCADPEASMAVLGAGFPTSLVTADVTLSTWLCDEDTRRLEARGGLAGELDRQVAIWKPVQHRIFAAIGGELEADNAAFLHDPLTLLSLVDASPLGFEELAIAPTIRGSVLRTLEVEAASGVGTSMRVATSVDAPAARAAIVERLLRLPA